MPFLNGSNATINGVAGLGPATNTSNFLSRVRDFLQANGWSVTNVEAIGGGQADVIFESDGVNTDESIVVRMQDGTVSNSISPLNTNVDVDKVRFTVAPYFDSGGQKVYNEAGKSKTDTEIPVDDDASFNFWVFTDTDSTHVIVVTQIGGAYYTIFLGRLQRQVYTELAKTAAAISVTTPGTPQEVTVSLDRTRPSTWTQGKILFVQSLHVNDNTGNGGDITTQELPVEMVTVGDLTGLAVDEVKLTVSRNYSTGALIGQDPLPLGVVRDAIGGDEDIAMIYDNGGGVNGLAYSAPNNQISVVSVVEMAGLDLASVLSAQDPDDYQNDQLIVGMFTYDETASKTFAFRHQMANMGRVSAVNNPLDELELPNGDRWLAFTVSASRVAVGKVN